jgi:hypothetical protein
MTEPTAPEFDATVDAEPVEPAVDATDGEQRGGGNREAAKYRTQLRDTEAQRDALTERLAVMQRREAERLASEHLADAADVWRDGLDVAELLDDDGNVDADKVAERAAAVAAAHPHWRTRPAAKRNPAATGGGLQSGATGPGYARRPTWQSVIRGSER